jgi:hypothetical protein
VKNKVDYRVWAARILIAVVVAWNLQCALVFLISPQAFAPGFELTGIPGAVAIRGTAILFVMWNIPYLVALWHPRRNRVSLWEALAMQAVGLAGEGFIFATLAPGHATLSNSILRFISFDAAGVVALVVATWMMRK